MGVKARDSKIKDRLERLSSGVSRAKSAMNVLFESPAPSGDRHVEGFGDKRLLDALRLALGAMASDMAALNAEPGSARRLVEVVSGDADSIDALNALARICRIEQFQRRFEACIFEALQGVGADWDTDGLDPQVEHALLHARILSETFQSLVPEYVSALEDSCGETAMPSRLNPAVRMLVMDGASMSSSDSLEVLKSLALSATASDAFSRSRSFRYSDGEFIPVRLPSIRKVKDFYGYAEARDKFMKFFEDFSAGRSNLPLLITSLPGFGKTHFTISHALHFPDITLILPGHRDLEKPLEGLIRRLARVGGRKFVLFFDDIDTREIDWYHFRTNIGGSFSLPPNIAVAIASNYQFPANICSRGKGFVFPVFDEVRCKEMVHDFLLSMGMRSPRPELSDVIAADYVEEFGQKCFEELSPRTLVRYLERYEKDAAKRKDTLEISKGDLIPQPDSQVFIDVNYKVLKSLYDDRIPDGLDPRMPDKQ